MFQQGMVNHKRPCPICNLPMEKQVALFCADTWTPIVLEHVDIVPRKFDTKKSLKDYCKKNQMESAVLL